jgi:hypothetical protein
MAGRSAAVDLAFSMLVSRSPVAFWARCARRFPRGAGAKSPSFLHLSDSPRYRFRAKVDKTQSIAFPPAAVLPSQDG